METRRYASKIPSTRGFQFTCNEPFAFIDVLLEADTKGGEREMEETDKAREKRLRIETELQGFLLLKSKVGDEQGGYRIVDAMTKRINAGINYDLTLDDVENYLNV